MTTQFETHLGQFASDPAVSGAICESVFAALEMCQVKAKCAGITSIPISDVGDITGIVGCHGDTSGFITINMSSFIARQLVGKFLGDDFDELCPQVVDGIGELGNIVAGGIKKGLVTTQWGFGNVTIPSVIVGNHYQIAHAAGLNHISILFDLPSAQSLSTNDRVLKISLALIKL